MTKPPHQGDNDMEHDTVDRSALRDELHDALEPLHVRGLWQLPAAAMPTAPTPVTRAWHWRAADIVPLAEQAGDAVVVGVGGERRALLLANPALAPTPFTTTTIQGAVQCLRGQETVPAHRHTPAAIRFILDGAGSYTTVDGIRCHMAPGDFILTPNWSWHDHTNPGYESVTWFDGLDFPIVTRLESVIFEDHPDGMQDVHHGASSLLRQPWAVTDLALTALFGSSPTDLASTEFVDPVSGSSICPTFDCWMHRGGPRLSAPARRKTGNSIFVVFSGSGSTSVGDTVFEWEAGDVFVAPSWAAVRHRPREVSNLFEMTDRPILRALGLYREELVP